MVFQHQLAFPHQQALLLHHQQAFPYLLQLLVCLCRLLVFPRCHPLELHRLRQQQYRLHLAVPDYLQEHFRQQDFLHYLRLVFLHYRPLERLAFLHYLRLAFLRYQFLGLLVVHLLVFQVMFPRERRLLRYLQFRLLLGGRFVCKCGYSTTNHQTCDC
ncbi:hypothetical protein HCQ94_02410 [Actinomyces sp. zg-332]|uniref:hypothetical protein n=1 Tax=Actinomyces sp. zg-332 TaxID=2708340 RepID=UPI0018C1F6B0|nr:hypothetical protein [Actinomyces sp. zg-332]QPK94571.1 hypothetical protein HCQ94_02410 [Actinomyces sp. zg-332]